MAVQDLQPIARPRPVSRRVLARPGFVGLGLALGLLGGATLGFVLAGSRLGLPVLLALAGALTGTALGWLASVVVARRPPSARFAPAPARRMLASRPPASAGSAAEPLPASEPEPAPDPLTALPVPADAPDVPTWIADPEDPARRRLWDGTAWTAHVWRPRE